MKDSSRTARASRWVWLPLTLIAFAAAAPMGIALLASDRAAPCVHYCYEHGPGPLWRSYLSPLCLEVFGVNLGSRPPPTVHYHCDRVPLWLIMVLAISLAGLPMLRTAKRRHRRRHGRCVKCGYDLTGNVSGACPECGRKLG
jgi:hypothetical protein